jgi:glycosyltransferase involved in cell wall biosynthesis
VIDQKTNLTIHVITYNEELMIEFFINHYRNLFPSCIIKLYDNYSTDDTVKIAERYGCEINYFDTDEKIDDSAYLELKNNIWKSAETDWVGVFDCDELLELSQEQLMHEAQLGSNIISSTAYSMINFEDQIDLESINLGFRDKGYDKLYVFNKSQISEINYHPGAHLATPVVHPGNMIRKSKTAYRALHYKYLSPVYSIGRNVLFAKRLSAKNIENKWGLHYLISPEDTRGYYESFRDKVSKIL